MIITESCEYGAVAFEMFRTLRDDVARHCSQSREISDHFWVATLMRTPQLHMRKSEGLIWY